VSLIVSQEQLLEICQKIKSQNLMSIDTEFMREKTYYPLLCLIQINVDGACFVIDVLNKNLDLAPFFSLLKDQKITKIIHCVHQDLEVLFPFLQEIPKAIFDTQIMANFCGFDYNSSYVKLVKELLNKDVDKAWQRSDWCERPLHPDQMQYALLDVFYLPEIYNFLREKLAQKQRLEWFYEEMENVLKDKNFDGENQNLFKKFSFQKKSKVYEKNIKLLIPWRDDKAKINNIPRSFIIKDEALQLIAERNPKSLAELNQINFANKLNEKLKIEILAILQNEVTPEPSQFQDEDGLNFKLNDKQHSLYGKARNLLNQKSLEQNLKPEFIINQSNLRMIILGHKKIENVLSGWRFIAFGSDLQNLIKN
jgi:ribonuclease D